MTNSMLKVEISGMKLKNPVIAASGTFGFGREYSEYIDLNKLGGISVKGLTLKPREGNKPPRIAETPAGILNSIGLQNPGVDAFIKDELPFLKQYDTAIIANIAGNTIEEYCELAEKLSDTDIDAFELNVSCPNVKEGGIAFGQDPKRVEAITKQVKKYSKKPLIIKLSPNVTDIGENAKAAEAGGADAISLINTLTGMKIDVERRAFVLANKTGGLSGPAIKPIAVRMVYQAACAVQIPIIGMGGIMNGEDALEFIMAGATMVAVGTANFINPKATMEVIDGIEAYLKRNNIKDINELIGCVR